MIELLYILSVVYLFVVFMIYPKSKEKLSIFKFSILGVVCLMCYNMIVCLILNSLKILINLQSLMIVNYILSNMIMYFIVKKKQIQGYYLEKNSIIYTVFLVILVSILSYSYFEDLRISFVTMDSSVHFSNARKLYESGELEGLIIGCYVNVAILFHITTRLIGVTNLYKVFILFDIFLLFIMGEAIYACIEKVMNKKRFMITILMSAFFLLGYPLNIMLVGFSYLQLAVTIIAIIIMILQFFEEKKVKNRYIYIFLFLCNFGVLFSYCLLSPTIYITELIYIIYINKKRKKKISFYFYTIFFVFGIPAISGILFFILPHLLNTPKENKFYNLEGYIYRNIWSNFILLIPIAIGIIKKRNNDSLVWKTLFIVQIIIMITVFFITKKFSLSTYYYYKHNYLLWFTIWYGAMYFINVMDDRFYKYIITYVIIYTLIATICMNLKKVYLTGEIYDEDENLTNAFDIYCNNYRIINICTLSDDYYMKVHEYIYNNIDLKSKDVLIISCEVDIRWIKAFNQFSDRNVFTNKVKKEEIEKWNNKEYEYLIIISDRSTYNRIGTHINNGKVIFENNSGIIYSNK
ncbi:MAG: hypothetical protein IKG56_05485 [Clostridia bacterium]|nr:hypothetical protein [Clostridia bacterium]